MNSCTLKSTQDFFIHFILFCLFLILSFDYISSFSFLLQTLQCILSPLLQIQCLIFIYLLHPSIYVCSGEYPHAWVPVEARGWHWVFSLASLHLLFWDLRVSPWTWSSLTWLHWLPMSSRDAPVSAHPRAAVTDVQCHAWLLNIGVRDSGPCVCMVDTWPDLRPRVLVWTDRIYQI